MRRTLLGFGIIILFAGLIVFSISNRFIETYDESVSVEESRVEDLPYGEWKTSAFFEKGERFFLSFPGPKLEGVPNGVELVINITDPEGGNTTLEIDFRMKTVGPELNITVKSKSENLEIDDSDFGDFNDSPEDFGGLVLLGGYYSAFLHAYGPSVAGYYYPPNATLPHMELWKRVPIRTYPDRQFLPVGGILIVAGLLLSVWAVRSSQQTLRGKRK